jgi:hypothetical protein
VPGFLINKSKTRDYIETIGNKLPGHVLRRACPNHACFGTSSGKWAFTLGTGKVSGIKGGGTYKCKMKSGESGAGYTCDTEGEYTLAAAKK